MNRPEASIRNRLIGLELIGFDTRTSVLQAPCAKAGAEVLNAPRAKVGGEVKRRA